MDFNFKKEIICINCGYGGHTSKNCNYPITSFGIILYKIIHSDVYYLMIQRKDSLCYSEFIRGKYDIKNIKFLIKLFSFMTVEEKEKISTHSFDQLWHMLWVNNTNNMKKEYNNSKIKFNKILNGYKIRSNEKIFNIDINTFVCNDIGNITECEWEFPKGRRKLHEHDVHCALREFEEETGLSKKFISIDEIGKKYEEIFIGKNTLRYRNVFYLAHFLKNNIDERLFNENNIDQIKEVKDVKWLSYDDVCIKIFDKVEKKELFKRIHNNILKYKL
jgi:8-oxo-dGTP pyrophosphatase MutT (NUDIX family)